MGEFKAYLAVSLLAVLSTCTAVLANPESGEIPFTISGNNVSDRELAGSTNQPERFILRDPAGHVAWSCTPKSHDPKERQWRPCGSAKQWFSHPGTYRFEIWMKSHATDHVVASFDVTGEELEVRASLTLWHKSNLDGPVVDLRLRRAVPNIDGVELRTAWSSGPTESPRYMLFNGSTKPIHGTRIWNNFFGFVQRRSGESWIRVVRGGFCGTVGQGQALIPGEETPSHEGFFIGYPRPFETGRFRYVLRYTLEPLPIGIKTSDLEAGRNGVSVGDVYEIYAPFTIE